MKLNKKEKEIQKGVEREEWKTVSNPAHKKRARRIQRKFITKIRIYQDKSRPDDSPNWNLVTTRDLSSSGIFFNYDQKIPIGTILEFNMTLPFAENVHCLGKVRRIEKEAPAKTSIQKIPVYGIAAHFINLDRFIRESLESFAKKFGSEK